MFWYEEEVKRLERERIALDFNPKTVFYGSSSVRLWSTLSDDFRSFQPVNLGFGGSTLAACVWFFDRIVAPFKPESIVIYAGDNDLGDGRHPEEVFIFFQQLAVKINQHFGDIPCYFISIKPSFSRWNMIDSFKYTNNIIRNEIIVKDNNWQFINIYDQMVDDRGFPIKEYFESDGLHLSPRGYHLWKDVVMSAITVNNQLNLT